MAVSDRHSSAWTRLAEAGVLVGIGACFGGLLVVRSGERAARAKAGETQRAVLPVIERVDKSLQGLERRYAMAAQRRARSDHRRRRTDVAVAAIAFALSAGGGLLLFIPSLAGPPLARDPGRIGVALLQQTSPQTMQANLIIDASNENHVAFTLAVSDFRTDHSTTPLQVVIYACGRVRENLVLEEVNGGKMLEMRPIDGSPIEFDSRLGDRSECTYAVSTTAHRQVLLTGLSSARLVTLSGDAIMYTLPGLTTLFQNEALGADVATPLATDSTLSLDLSWGGLGLL